MPGDVAESVTGTVALCDHASNDRGKWNILGLGWSTCPPEWTSLNAFVSVQWPSHWHGRHQFRAALQIWRGGELEAGDENASSIAEQTLDGVVEVPEPTEEGLAPPVYTIGEAFNVPVQLEPETAYLVRLVVNDTPIAWDVFVTNPATPAGTDDGD